VTSHRTRKIAGAPDLDRITWVHIASAKVLPCPVCRAGKGRGAKGFAFHVDTVENALGFPGLVVLALVSRFWIIFCHDCSLTCFSPIVQAQNSISGFPGLFFLVDSVPRSANCAYFVLTCAHPYRKRLDVNREGWALAATREFVTMALKMKTAMMSKTAGVLAGAFSAGQITPTTTTTTTKV
jgi:hypothetical protein